METGQPKHVACAGGIIFDRGTGGCCLILRGKAPSAGTWSIPGGRCEPGETAEQACVREVAEETGLQVQLIRWVGRVQRDGPGGVVFDIDDFICAVMSGTAAGRRRRRRLSGGPIAPKWPVSTSPRAC